MWLLFGLLQFPKYAIELVFAFTAWPFMIYVAICIFGFRMAFSKSLYFAAGFSAYQLTATVVSSIYFAEIAANATWDQAAIKRDFD